MKYNYDFWRPVTAIRAGGTDGNPLTVADPTWAPLGAPKDNGSGTNFTPPFPSYVSGHATFGGALFRMMANFYGTDNIHFTIGSDEFNGVTTDQNGNVRPVVTRSFDSFSQAAEENGQSRIYLGIHWSFDKDQGIKLGTSIADYVFANFLRPSHDRDLDVNNATELLYTESNTPNGPVMTPSSVAGHHADMPDGFRMAKSMQPVNLAFKVERARLQTTANGNPQQDLDAAFASANLLSVLQTMPGLPGHHGGHRP